MRYRPSISYFIFDEERLEFLLNEFLNYDKFISLTVPLKMANIEVAFISTVLDDYYWMDRVI